MLPQTEHELTHSRDLDRGSVVDECRGKMSLPNALSTKENVVTYLVGSGEKPNQKLSKWQYEHILQNALCIFLSFYTPLQQCMKNSYNYKPAYLSCIHPG